MTISRKELGKKGENYAKLYLQRKLYRIIEQNWQCRSGELDLIALHQEQLIIVEVRTRTTSSNTVYNYGTAEESVDARKQVKLRKLAELYMYQKNAGNNNVRFDVITVYVDPEAEGYRVHHYENAF